MSNKRAVRYLGLLLPLGAGLLYGGLRLSARPAQKTSDKAIIGKQADGTYFVPTGQTLAPAGRNLTFEGRPVDMALRPDGKILAVMLAREIRLLDTASGQFQTSTLPGTHNFGGIAWSNDGRTLYATGKARAEEDEPQTGAVFVTRFDDAGHATPQKPIAFGLQSRIKPNLQAKDAEPCGLALSPDDKTLYVTLFNNGTLAAVDLTYLQPGNGKRQVRGNACRQFAGTGGRQRGSGERSMSPTGAAKRRKRAIPKTLPTPSSSTPKPTKRRREPCPS